MSRLSVVRTERAGFVELVDGVAHNVARGDAVHARVEQFDEGVETLVGLAVDADAERDVSGRGGIVHV